MAVQHHLDQPLMHVKELDISPGFETQIAVSPVLFSTTNEALRRFEPEQRGCYSGSGGYEVSSNVIQNLNVFLKKGSFEALSEKNRSLDFQWLIEILLVTGCFNSICYTLNAY